MWFLLFMSHLYTLHTHTHTHYTHNCQAPTQVSSVSLTEMALQRHNLAEVPRVPMRPKFSGKEISVNNRYGILHL